MIIHVVRNKIRSNFILKTIATFSKTVQCVLSNAAADSSNKGRLKQMHLLSREDLIRQVDHFY